MLVTMTGSPAAELSSAVPETGRLSASVLRKTGDPQRAGLSRLALLRGAFGVYLVNRNDGELTRCRPYSEQEA